MKKSKLVFIICFILITNYIQAETYYFSSSDGSDLYTSEQAKYQETPWQSIDKLNSIMAILQPGDSVLFKRDDGFPGTITIGASGIQGLPITFGAYGTGSKKPVLDNRLELKNWINVKGNIWETTNNSLNGQPTALMIDDVLQALGRYPNIDEPNRGYRTISSHPTGSRIEFSDNTLTSDIDWTGAEAVIRTKQWTLERRTVTNHSGNKITLGSTTGYEISNNYGYFFQNHPAALDKDGEWCYISNQKRIRLYSSIDPNEMVIKVTNMDYCFNIDSKSHLRINGLAMCGAKESALNLNHVSYFTIKNCDITESGTNAIRIGPFWAGYSGTYGLNASDSITITNNTFINTQSNCINIGGKRIVFTGNTINNTGLVPGMAESGQNSLAFNTLADEILINGNTINNTGYSGISFLWSKNIEISENVINHYCSVTDDGAGIYCYKNSEAPVPHNRKIVNNIVLNGIAAPEGTNNNSYTPAEGIYIDGASPNVEILNNTVAYCANNGIFLNNATGIKLKGNRIFACKYSLYLRQYLPDSPITNCDIQNNIFVANPYETNNALLNYPVQNEYDLTKLGSLDNNIYCHPFLKNDYIKFRDNQRALSLNLAEWQEFSGYDGNSTVSPRSFSPYEGVISSKYGIPDSPMTIYSGPGNSGRYQTSLPSISAGKTYLFKLRTKGTWSGTIKCYFSQNVIPYSKGSDNYNIEVDTTRRDHEIIITATKTMETPNLYMNFTADYGNANVNLDNVELYEVEASSPTDFIRFEYNTTTSNRSITADKNYITPAGEIISAGNTVSIPALGSVILLKNDLGTGAQNIQVNTNEQLFNLYPNPSTSKVYIKSETGIIPTKILIYDITGREVQQEIIKHGNLESFDISSLLKGIYLVKIFSNNEAQTIKMIKQEAK